MKTKEKIYRIVAVYLAINIISGYFFPVAAFALTGGPSQPEVESFEPIGTTEMVDVFSGDFNYNIPLLNVPGPNGSYPVNLAYHAGIGMEQEASWVGLGWNINPGVINRMMRGLPDDFNGATIEKQYQSKPNNTLSVGLSGPAKDEFMGFEKGGIYGQLYYNNYKGVGYNLGVSLSSNESNSSGEGLSKTLSLSLSSETGLGVTPGISYSDQRKKHLNSFHLGVNYNSVEGLNSISLRSERRAAATYASKSRNRTTISASHEGNNLGKTSSTSSSMNEFKGFKNSPSSGSGVSFCSNGYVPNVSHPQSGMNLRFALSFGSIKLNHIYTPFSYSEEMPGTGLTVNISSITQTSYYSIKPGLNYNASLSLQWSPKDPIEYDAYGYLHTQHAGGQSILDFNREKDVPPTKDVPSLPVPVYTFDSYMIKGQGIGGVFRPYRNDISVLHDADQSYLMPTLILTGEMAADPASASNHWGIGSGVGFTTGNSGDWNNMDYEIYPGMGATSTSSSTPLYEPVYFRSAGDQAENTPFMNSAGGSLKPARLDMAFGFSGLSLQAKLKNKLEDKDGSFITFSSPLVKTERDKRNQNIEYYSNEMLQNIGGIQSSTARVYDLNKFPILNQQTGDFENYNYDRGTEPEFEGSAYEKQLGVLSVVNPDGNRYYYGLPAYNLSQDEIVFSVDNATSVTNHASTVYYGSADDPSNNEGDDHFYSRIHTPAYSHSHLLTAITGADYVDITGNGPSDDDLGYWIRFNYTKVQNYDWRLPYATNEGNLNSGNISNVHDDKVSYVHGKKELYYLNSIESKTHVACFSLFSESNQLREDGRGVNDADNSIPTAGARQYHLQKIDLYSKTDLQNNGNNAKSIKTVRFEYDYLLCKNVENNHSGATNNGKLTLTKVWFEYLGNNRGELSPYIFNYHDNIADENPDYDLGAMDRWGNYQENKSADHLYNSENPYSDQSQNSAANSDRAKRAGAWSLKEITLPSGGIIKIEYESDDYAYVQAKRAMQMVKVTGTADNSITPTSELDKDHLKILFEFESPLDPTDPEDQQQLLEYGRGIDKLYFKIFEKLKKYHVSNSVQGQDVACDYVEGYANVVYAGTDPSMGFQAVGTNGLATGGWIEVEEERVTNNPADLRTTHPFRKAGWQYLRMQRPDLFGPRNDFGGALFTLNPVTQAVQQMLNMTQALAGYYNYCWMRGFCKSIVIDDSDAGVNYRPSYIRLNSPDYRKFGGGHRVKSVRISDNWQVMTDESTPNNTSGHEHAMEYGQQFEYTMPDSTSSGVAEYEPLVGGEEIPHHRPVAYSSNKFLSNDKALYIEEPFGESMFPPANVGYRRVIVKNLDWNGVTKNKEGIKVYEFYTAKEFPVRVDKTEDVLQKKFWLPLPIPFLGSMSFNNRGYSQGYSVELNDMHGKPKSVATYSSNADIDNPFTQPVTKLDYIYKTQEPYNANGENYLDNTVTVLDGDANTRTGQLGLITEMYMDNSERYSFNHVFSVDPNFDITGYSPIPSLTLVPSLEINEAQFRSSVTVKVIQRTGVLIQTRAFDQGSMAVTDNLMFDAQTGVPLLTSVNNNFDKPVYSYKYAGHWAYTNMGSAAKNWGAVFALTVGSGGWADYAFADRYFTPGDELVNTTNNSLHYWVDEVSMNAAPVTDKIKLIDENGTPLSAGTYNVTVIRSGYRNQQSITNGTIVSLSNPVTQREFPLFTALNTWLSNPENFAIERLTFNDCVNNESQTAIINIDETHNYLTFGLTGEPCARIEFPEDFTLTSYTQLEGYSFTKMGNDVKIYNSVTGDIIWAKWWTGTDACFEECIPDVLHADATTFYDRWSYFMADIGNPTAALTGSNEYRNGTAGIWRSASTHLYQVDRKQEDPASIDKDGTYKHFVPYNWAAPGQANTRWSLSARTTLYSPFGFALEERDTINVYSAALYGYNNSLATAVAANSQYFEAAFDGFEDYPTTYPEILTTGPWGHGHALFKTGATTYPVLGSIAHTGQKSIRVDNGAPAYMSGTVVADHSALSSTTNTFQPIAGKKYAVSCWIKNPDQPYTGTATVTVKVNGITQSTYTTSKNDIIIEGWHQVNVEIPETTVAGNTYEISIASTDAGKPVYVDDFRIVPFKGAIKTYVYNPVTLWLVAELDNRNFATFYNYDEEGALTQVRRETLKGIITIKTSRNNIRQSAQ